MKTTTVINIKSIRIYNKNNKKCPECGKQMTWFEGLLSNKVLDMNVGRYVCESCNLFCKTEDSRALMKGRKLSKQYVNDPNFKFTDIIHLSVANQLGILREIQHGKKRTMGLKILNN